MDRDRQYHYPTQSQKIASTLGQPANTEFLRRLEDSVCTAVYHAAPRRESLQAHLQKSWLQLALTQLPLLSSHYPWYTRFPIPVPAGYTSCICDHREGETWDHFKSCLLYRGLDTLADWNRPHTIPQHTSVQIS